MKGLKRSAFLLLVLFVTMVIFPNKAFAAAPVHSFTFDSDNGTTVVDSVTGSNVSGVATGTTLITGANGTGYARHFNAGNYIAFNNIVLPAGGKSISFKIRMTTAPSSAQYIFGNVKNASNYGVCGMVYSDGKIGFENTHGGTSFVLISNTTICDNQWHTILYTWDGSINKDSAKIYVDDLINPNNTLTPAFTESIANAGTFNLCLGSLAGAVAPLFTGDLDEFSVWSSYSAVPFGLNAIADTKNTAVNLSWNSVSGATSYNVKRSTVAGGPYATIATTTTNSYTDSDVSRGITYYYIITAVVSGSESEKSNEASAILTGEFNGNKAILEITMTNRDIKEYCLTAAELDKFLTWYDNREAGIGKSYYVFTKTSNVKPFLSRKEYISFKKISSFEVKDYND